MKKKFESEIEKVINESNDVLYGIIGKAIIDPGLSLNDKDDSSILVYGKLWFNRNKKILKKKICKSDLISQYLKSETKHERVTICAALCDLLVGQFGHIPLAAVSVLIIKSGLDSFCGVIKIENER